MGELKSWRRHCINVGCLLAVARVTKATDRERCNRPIRQDRRSLLVDKANRIESAAMANLPEFFVHT